MYHKNINVSLSTQDDVHDVIKNVSLYCLDRESLANAIVYYGIFMSDVFISKTNNYNGIQTCCDLALSKIKDDDGLKRFISFVSMFFKFLGTGTGSIKINVDDNKRINIEHIS